jgi:L-ascorbate metabolism protein UlaG (beta-lactamase superfamily)
MKLKGTIFSALSLILFLSGNSYADVSYQQIRNATGKLSYDDVTFLIDPMLASKGTYQGFEGTFNSEFRNPTVDLPMSKNEVMKDVDAVIVTHTHLDHWDDEAQKLLDKDLPIFVQDKYDAEIISKQGFKNIHIVGDATEFKGVKLTRIRGAHGTNAMFENIDIALILGEAMGVVFEKEGEKTAYLMGDTIWNAAVSKTLYRYTPEILVMNTGYAKVLSFNDGIIMGTQDVLKASLMAPQADIVTVHMDAINHCTVGRKHMKDFVKNNNLIDKVKIPEDGEIVRFN